MAKPTSPAKAGWKAQAEKMKQDLLKRTEEAANRQKEGSTQRGSYFIKEKVANIPFFSPDAGEHIIDVVPFVAGRNDPRNPEGSYAYVLDMWVHFNIGDGNDSVVCPKLNFNKRCPICEYMKKQRLERKEWESIRAKRRTIYLVWPHDEEGKLEKKGVHLWDVAHWYFEDKITELAKKPRGGGYVVFQSPDKDGKQIRFNIKKGKYTDKNTGETGDRKEFTGHQFIDRESDLPDKIVSHGLVLDELVNIKPSYAEIEKLFLGDSKEEEETESEEAEEAPEEEPEQEPEAEEEPESEEDQGDGLDDLDRTALKKYIQENGLEVKVYKNDSDDDIRDKIREAQGAAPEPEAEPEPEPEPEPESDGLDELDRNDLKTYIVKNKLEVKVYKTDTDDDIRAKIREAQAPAQEEPEEQPKKGGRKPAAAAKKGGKAIECPAGGTYGKDADQFEECLQCAHYKTCSVESEK